MRSICLPLNQQLKHAMTGKFKAPTPDWKHETFYLSDYELFVMTEGTLYLTYNNENFTVNTGEYLLLPPCNVWRQGFKSAYSAFYWLHFTADLGNDIPLILPSETSLIPASREFFTIPQYGKLPHPEKVVVLMKQLQDMVKNQYPTMAVNAMTTTIISEVYGQLVLLPPIDDTKLSQKQIYNDIVDYINTNVDKNLKIADIAKAFSYNEKYLSHRFAELTGTSLKQYILKVKIDSANFMLSDTNKSISQIASELGFSDNHNFTRIYKKCTGLTPTEYRNAYSQRLLYHV